MAGPLGALVCVLWLTPCARATSTGQNHITPPSESTSLLASHQTTSQQPTDAAHEMTTMRPELEISSSCETGSLKSGTQKLILFWTKEWFAYEIHFHKVALRQHSQPAGCRFTEDRRLANASDVIIFHAFFLDMDDLPVKRRGQRWALWSLEPAVHAPRTMDRHSTDGLFDWTVSYQSTSDVAVGHWTLAPVDCRRPRSAPLPTDATHCPSDSPWLRSSQCHRPSQTHATGKTKLVAWFVSNCATGGGRMEYVRELQRHVQVDIYGRCGNLTCGRPGTASDSCYRLLQRHYFFYLSFENSLCDEYVTEKLFNALRFNVVPVVFGGAAYRTLAPPGSFVDALAHSPRQLAQKLTRIAADREAYLAHFRWRSGLVVVEDLLRWTRDLCGKVQGAGGQRWAAAGDVAGVGRQHILDWHGILARCRRYDGDGKLTALFW